MTDMVCPLCGSGKFEDFRKAPRSRCVTCGSRERTRVAKMFLDRHVKPQLGMRVLHFAPEPPLGRYLAGLLGDGYTAADIAPERYLDKLGHPVIRFDLCTDAAALPDAAFDLILHNHVMEHLPCNVTCVLQHLHRAIRPGGVHLFSVPISKGFSAEDLDPGMPPAERTDRFGQHDHMRRIGRADFDRSFGPILGIPSTYSLTEHFSEAELRRANIRKRLWNCSGSSVFYLRKPADGAHAA